MERKQHNSVSKMILARTTTHDKITLALVKHADEYEIRYYNDNVHIHSEWIRMTGNEADAFVALRAVCHECAVRIKTNTIR